MRYSPAQILVLIFSHFSFGDFHSALVRRRVYLWSPRPRQNAPEAAVSPWLGNKSKGKTKKKATWTRKSMLMEVDPRVTALYAPLETLMARPIT